MSGTPVYRVIVTDNLVCAIERIGASDEIEVARDELDVSSQLSRNNLENGRLDGAYYFDDPEQARQFATLCLDFVKRLAERTIETLDSGDFTGELPCTNPRHDHGR